MRSASPDYYGRNLNALNDCLRDVSGCAYGFSAEETGLVLVIEGYDTLLVRSPEIAHYLVNSYADAARLAAQVGNRMRVPAPLGRPGPRRAERGRISSRLEP